MKKKRASTTHGTIFRNLGKSGSKSAKSQKDTRLSTFQRRSLEALWGYLLKALPILLAAKILTLNITVNIVIG
jgi:hypothetical protein